ncbi:hypothetical protein [Candidatus Odyssella acanthamoebae]|uniref:Uncharacterized protein n=1 Tax=Candidatus Odyssella acanthamoebae TaxID=91604 RepID=A0A077AZT4_9PROT|nr:hypothetical protein [Candidatus Paracaedibacter acanthamoebae]AIK97223.1 hypothetical protein ID47_11510 [Candidatus Paracaedibacter acanthamoebae]
MFLKKLLTPLFLLQCLYAADTNDPVVKEAATIFSQSLESFNVDEEVKSTLEINTVELMNGLKKLDDLQLEATTIIDVLDSFEQPAILENYIKTVLETANTLIKANLLSMEGVNNNLPAVNRNALNINFIQIRDICTQLLQMLADPTIIKNAALSSYLKLEEMKQKNDEVKYLNLLTPQSSKQYGDTMSVIHTSLTRGLRSLNGETLMNKLHENADTVDVEKAKVLSTLTTLQTQLNGVTGNQSLIEPLKRIETRLTTEE